MKRFLLLYFLLFISSKMFAQNKNTELFDDGWKFYKGGVLAGQNVDFNDSGWSLIDLPHDWSIEDLPGTNSPFNKDAISQVGGGFTTGGTAWYRKTFKVNTEDSGRIIKIQFDGVYMNADVWINGEHLGNHPYGYTGFVYDISKNIKFDVDNIIAVEVKNEGQNSRWYSGSRIYRHVWLQTLSPIHIDQWGTFITTPEVSSTNAKINIKTKVINQSNQASAITLEIRILSENGIERAHEKSTHDIIKDSSYNFSQNIELQNPLLCLQFNKFILAFVINNLKEQGAE